MTEVKRVELHVLLIHGDSMRIWLGLGGGCFPTHICLAISYSSYKCSANITSSKKPP